MPNAERVDIIDLDNTVIGTVPRWLLYQQKRSHRIVHVMLVQGERVFLVRRAFGVRYLPGYFCTSAGGHVLAGEDAYAAALRELDEEIGLQGPLDDICEFDFVHDFRVHVSLYMVRHSDKQSLTLNPSEVLSGEFYSAEEIDTLDRSLFHPQLMSCIERTFEFLRLQKEEI